MIFVSLILMVLVLSSFHRKSFDPLFVDFFCHLITLSHF